ncbi:hypothetical protein Y1Q_0013821 [Alligator mississippiensis]|uniref:Uncharacterized protein n=1 Tax=Alligator mississippiensis TaxID=8496 RepID=A0A151NFM7_ALLMI|nr:hypothetical protein Y1Q_0013821 [Alligator mississippiensis]
MEARKATGQDDAELPKTLESLSERIRALLTVLEAQQQRLQEKTASLDLLMTELAGLRASLRAPAGMESSSLALQEEKNRP